MFRHSAISEKNLTNEKMANSYEDDPVKEKARKEIYIFADRHLPRDRNNATALYLASTNGRESWWLDKLGIPRANRLILEGDPAKVEAVRQANTGIRVLPMTTHDFFASKEAETYGPWWYCGLDYESTFNNSVASDLTRIGSQGGGTLLEGTNGMLIDKGIMYTNLVGQREQDNVQEMYAASIISEIPETLRREILGTNFNFEVVYERVKKSLPREAYEKVYGKGFMDIAASRKELFPRLRTEVLKELSDVELSRIRKYAISARIFGLLSFSVYGADAEVEFTDISVPGGLELLAKNDCEIYMKFPTPRLTRNDFWVIPFGTVIDQIQNIFSVTHEIKAGYSEGFYKLQDHAIRYFERGNMPLIPLMVKQAFRQGYTIIEPQAVEYTSNKRTNMMLDIFQVRRNSQVKGFLQRLIDEGLFIFYGRDRPYLGYAQDQHLRSRDLLNKRTKQIYSKLEREIGFLIDSFQYSYKIPKRVYLGNSALPILTLSAARKCALEGLTDEQIAERYHVSNWGRVAAVRANITRGNIKPKPVPVKKVVEKEPEQIGCKHLISRDIYRNLPTNLRMRLDYFIEEVVEPLKAERQNRIRQVFSESHLSTLIDNSIEPIRFYAFFDDVQLAIVRGRRITPDYLDEQYRSLRDAKMLIERAEAPSVEREKGRKPEKERRKRPSDQIKEEIRGLITLGIPKEEIWETYKEHFDSRLQFGAIIAWASPKLAIRRVV